MPKNLKKDTPTQRIALDASRSVSSIATDLPLSSLARLVLLGEEHSGRDEMNLAGNPFALLQAPSKSSQTSLCREWERTLTDGRVVKARWEVVGHPELGLPGPSDDLLLLVLMGISREIADETGNWPKTVHFSRYGLLSRMGWGDESRNYRTLANSFTRLTNVTVNTRYAFYDAKSKQPVADSSFHMLASFQIIDEPRGRKEDTQLPLSHFTWSDEMYDSFLAGNVRSLSLQFVQRLELPLSKRLFRFLDAMRWAAKPPRREFSIGVMNLRDRLGMTPYSYVSKVKEKLLNAHEELIDCGYLADVSYVKGVSDMLVCYQFGTTGKPDSKPVSSVPEQESPTPADVKSASEPVPLLVAPPPHDPEVELRDRRNRVAADVFLELPSTTQAMIRRWALDELDQFHSDRYIRLVNMNVAQQNDAWFMVARRWRDNIIERVWSQHKLLCDTRLARMSEGADTYIDSMEFGEIPVPEAAKGGNS